MLERGELVLVPYPFTDLTASKRRPVLVLRTADAYGDVIGLPVTSRPQPEHSVALTSADMTDGSLPAASWIRTDRIVTLGATLVLKKIGRISEAVLSEALDRFCSVIGCHAPRR